ncbi:TIGR00645 family protein [Falsiroseomonas sp.]|uniref:TIGR00645 family protein n=1 Tax=Falsiroseomonas sp. TaxID=2870721 RepID=UPI0035679FBF
MYVKLDKAVLASRWILAVFFIGLGVALAAYAVRFGYNLWIFTTTALSAEETAMLIGLLHLLDAALVASLVMTVVIASYDSLVSRLSEEDKQGKPSWVATVDPGNLKIKLSTSLVAISSIHLLQIFMETSTYDDRKVMWALAIHGTFLVGALVLGTLDRLTAHTEHGKL